MTFFVRYKFHIFIPGLPTVVREYRDRVCDLRLVPAALLELLHQGLFDEETQEDRGEFFGLDAYFWGQEQGGLVNQIDSQIIPSSSHKQFHY